MSTNASLEPTVSKTNIFRDSGDFSMNFVRNLEKCCQNQSLQNIFNVIFYGMLGNLKDQCGMSTKRMELSSSCVNKKLISLLEIY